MFVRRWWLRVKQSEIQKKSLAPSPLPSKMDARFPISDDSGVDPFHNQPPSRLFYSPFPSLYLFRHRWSLTPSFAGNKIIKDGVKKCDTNKQVAIIRPRLMLGYRGKPFHVARIESWNCPK